MAFWPVHLFLPVTSPCLQSMLTKWFLHQYSDHDQAMGLDLQNAFFPLKKKEQTKIKRFSYSHFPDLFPSISPQTAVLAEPLEHCSAVQRWGEDQEMEWDAKIPPAITATRDRTLQSCSLMFSLQVGSDSGQNSGKVTWHHCTSMPRFLALHNGVTEC